METIPFYLVFLQSLPEAMILLCLGLVLTGIKPCLKQVFLIALFVSLASYFVRNLPLPLGVNILIVNILFLLPLFIILLVYIHRLAYVAATVSTFMGFIFLSLAEMVLNFVVSAITGVTVLEALNNPVWRVLFPLPEFFILSAVIILLQRYHITFFEIHDYLRPEGHKQ